MLNISLGYKFTLNSRVKERFFFFHFRGFRRYMNTVIRQQTKLDFSCFNLPSSKDLPKQLSSALKKVLNKSDSNNK